jgi:hypothetical protein
MFIPVIVGDAWSTRLNFTGQFAPTLGISTRYPITRALAPARQLGRVNVKEADAAFEQDHCDLFALGEVHAGKHVLERFRVTKMLDGVMLVPLSQQRRVPTLATNRHANCREIVDSSGFLD